jgi:hypothetical protein
MSEPPWPPGSYAEAHAEERAKIEAERKATENELAAAMIDIGDLDREDLACLGLRRAFEDDFFSDLKKQAQEEYFANLPKPRKPRKPTLESVAKQASKVGIDVARYEVKPDGAITVITGEPTPVEPGNPWPLDEFRKKETKQ